MRLFPVPSAFGLVATLLAAGAVVSGPLLRASAPAAKAAKKPLSYQAYDAWTSIREPKLSRQGDWLVYALVRQEGDGELVARNLKSGQEWRQPRGLAPVITGDDRYVAFSIAPPQAALAKAKKDKKKPEEMPKAGLGVLDLATGKVATLDRVKSFQLGKDGGRFLAALLEKPEEKKAEEPKPAPADTAMDPEPDQRARAAAAAEAKEGKKKEAGTELVIWELASGAQTRVANVTECLWNRDGAWLAYAVSVKEAAKGKEPAKPPVASADPAQEGVYLWRAADAKTTPLLTGAGSYKGLAVDEAGGQLAFLSNQARSQEEAPAFSLYGWRDGAATARELAGAHSAGLPAGWTPSEHGRLTFSKDGQRLFLGTAPAPKAEPKEAPEPLKVDLWSWKDPELQPAQKIRSETERQRSYRAVLHLDQGRLVQLGGLDLPEVDCNDNPKVALGYAPGAYLHLASWDQSYADVYGIDLETGARRLLVRKLPWEQPAAKGPAHPSQLSPAGKYLFHFDAPERAWMAVPTDGGAPLNLTRGLKTAFQNETHDTPELPGAYGNAGWTAGDAALLVYDRFDVWELKPAGARNLTAGAGRRQRTALRVLNLDPEAKTVNGERPLLLSGSNEDSKASGFFRASWDGSDPVRLLWAEQQIGGLQKARNADTLVFTRQRYDLFPDLWISDASLARPVQVSHANPQQAEYLWGSQELMSYVNGDGKVLQALVAKPENFDPRKQYPLMVYIYERFSNNLHTYPNPAPSHNITFARYTSQGYVVLRPDIEYETGYPGKSAMKCVLPAIDKLLESGSIDRARIGIQGHSWGAYEITYMVGQTNIFKAAEAGAPVANMTSAYGGIRWGTGMSRAFQYEKSQSRIGAAPWERPLQFIENSPLFWVERVQTPLLMVHNDEDDAVPWYQGIEYFSALRRLGKEVWMFNFNGEKHHLAVRDNQKYWAVHMDEFFDHLLLGKPRPAWMDTPVPYNERGKRDMTPFYTPSTAAPVASNPAKP